MKYLFCLIVIMSVGQLFGHEYYFAFAEARYNSQNQKIELSISVSTHDIEHWFEDKGIHVKELEDHTTDSVKQVEFGKQLLTGLSFKNLDKLVPFRIIGYQVNKNGLTDFFFESSTLSLAPEMTVKFNLLMDQYPQQQNKLTFIYNNVKHTYPFIATKPEQVIQFDTFKE